MSKQQPKMTREVVLARLRTHLPQSAGHIEEGQNLIETGVLDSLGFVDFLTAIEQEFAVSIPEDVVYGNRFNTLVDMAQAIIEAAQGTHEKRR